MSLSKQQIAYVNATGNTVLCACPGSGKTYAVVEKAKANIILESINEKQEN